MAYLQCVGWWKMGLVSYFGSAECCIDFLGNLQKNLFFNGIASTFFFLVKLGLISGSLYLFSPMETWPLEIVNNKMPSIYYYNLNCLLSIDSDKIQARFLHWSCRIVIWMHDPRFHCVRIYIKPDTPMIHTHICYMLMPTSLYLFGMELMGGYYYRSI